MLRVTFSNSAGPLESEDVATPEEAITAAFRMLRMLRAAGDLYDGDTLTVVEVED